MNDLWIEKFRREALPGLSREFKPDKVIAFGSRIRGTAREESDIDVILVSSYFNDIPFLKRMPLVLRKVPFPNMLIISVILRLNMSELRANPV